MREVAFQTIVDKVSEALIDMNYRVDPKMLDAFQNAIMTEQSPLGRSILKDLLVNSEIAGSGKAPICQDTGMVVAFVTYGQEVKLSSGSITDAINQGVEKAYVQGYLRKSVVKDPFNRINTGDNTPAVIHYDVVEGDELSINIGAKGFGSENMSKSKMLKPSDGLQGVFDFVLETVRLAGSNPCPPIVVGIGVGGTLDKAAQIAKKALFRPLGTNHLDSELAEIEHRLLEAINALGIGPQGLGGTTTAIAVNIEVYPTHIAEIGRASWWEKV